MFKAFGQQTPTGSEDAVSWATWSDGAGGTVSVVGDADWGKLSLPQSGAEGRSAVYDLGNTATRTFYLTENRYGTGDNEPSLQIRGSTTLFAQDDELPAWVDYTTPVSYAWRYVQVRGLIGTILPQNLLTAPDVLLEDFETADDWTAANGSLAANTTAGQFKTGTQSIKLTTDSGATATMTKTISLDNLDNYGFLGIWAFIHNAVSSYTSITIRVSSTTDFSKNFSYTFLRAGSTTGTLPWQNRASYLRAPIGDMTNTGGESWDNTMIRLRIEVASASGIVAASIDDFVGGYKRVPVIMMYHDDGTTPLYNNGAFAKHVELGIPANLYLTASGIRSDATGSMTLAMLTELYNAGWCIASHGFGGFLHCFGDLTQTQQELDVGATQLYIRDILKLPGSERHFSYMGGGTVFDNNTAQTALSNTEALTARMGWGYARPAFYPPGDWYNIECASDVNVTSLEDMEDLIDATISKGQFLQIGFDQLDSTGWTYRRLPSASGLYQGEARCRVDVCRNN